MRRILMAALAAASIGGFAGAAYSGAASKVGVQALRPDMVQHVQDRYRDCRDWDRDSRRCRDRDWDENRWRGWDRDGCRRGHDRYLLDGHWLMCARDNDQWRDCSDWDRDHRRCRDRDWNDNRMRDYWGVRSCRMRGHDRYFEDGRWHMCPRRRY